MVWICVSPNVTVGWALDSIEAVQVRRRRHDVRADQRVLHHRAVQRLVVAAAAAVACLDRAVGGGEQHAGPAPQICDAQRLHCLGVSPVHVEPRDRQLGEQPAEDGSV